MNFYPFHIGDYISHTAHLTDAEDLAYRRMIDLYYQTEKPFTDINWVARKVKSTPEIVRILLEEFFEYWQTDCAWRNKRADEEIAKYHAKANSARNANLKRWQSDSDKKPNKKSDLKSDADQILTSNHEPRTKTSSATTKIELPDWLPEKAWIEWVEYRSSSKKPMSQLASTKFLNQLETFVKDGYDPVKLIDLAIASGWRTVYARDDAKTKAGSKPEWMKGLTYVRT
jgi:uncharacterized protein YdaU (DUF1376 family)